jgi:hypothetical protein
MVSDPSSPDRNSMAISKQARKSVRPILISPQRRAEKKKITLVKGYEMKRVHFRIPKAKEQRSFAPVDASAREIQMWLIAVLVPLAWELWAFPFRLAFCDIMLGNALFVYDVDVACDVVFVFDMIGVHVITFFQAALHLLILVPRVPPTTTFPRWWNGRTSIKDRQRLPFMQILHGLCHSVFQDLYQSELKKLRYQQNSSCAFRPALTQDSEKPPEVFEV